MENNIILSEIELRKQLFEAKAETKLWKNRYLKMSQEKSNQLQTIETNLMLLEAKLLQERKSIKKKLIQQNRLLKEQKDKIEKLTAVNQKLLAAMMVIRYQKPSREQIRNGSMKKSNKHLDTDIFKLEDTSDKKTDTSEPRKTNRHTIHNPLSVNGSELIACRARAYADQVGRSESEKSPRTYSEKKSLTKRPAHRSQSLPHGKYSIML
ncbi:uncharacterized protein LOC120342675 [Styela clava]